MRITVLGGSGAFPTADQGCSGYLVERDGFRLLIDPGYATLPRLLAYLPAAQVDAVLVSHGHPDHCADLNPLLRARDLPDEPAPALPVYTLPGALDPVLALDRPGMLDRAYELREFDPGDRFEVGPFEVHSRPLPHYVPDAGFRISAGGRVLMYPGDSGPSPDLVELARDADVVLAEATYLDAVPDSAAPFMTSAAQAGRYAAEAGAGRLVLTHLWPGTDPGDAIDAAAAGFAGPIDVARPDLQVELG